MRNNSLRIISCTAILALLVLGGCVTPRDLPPRWQTGKVPTYPAGLKASGTEGFVTVAYRVLVDGTVRDPEVIAAQPPGVFDDAALRAVATWQYRPAERGGVAVEAERVVSTLRFSQGGAAAYRGL